MIALLLAWQDTQASAPPPAMLDIPFDLAHAPPPSPDSDTIVIQGRRLDVRLHDLPDMPGLHENPLPRAETGLGNGRLSLDAAPTVLPNGMVSNRVMMTFKLPF